MSGEYSQWGEWLDKPDKDGWWWHWEIHKNQDPDDLDICIVLVSGDSIYYGGYAGKGGRVSQCGTHGTTVKWQRVQPHSKPIV